MNKVILILLDGLRYDTATAGMGCLGHLVESKLASLYKVNGELPSMSRPMYETIHTGLPSSEHGILSNIVVRRSTKPNVFQLCKEAGKVTAASAYSWFSELYNRAPYDRIDDKEVDDPALAIQHGRFYTEDSYPDEECLAAAGLLVRKYFPDYLLVHPMGMDYHGELYGADSKEYRNHAIRQDAMMAPLIAEWSRLGYQVLISADHGMSRDGAHGGTTPDVREVPLYVIRPHSAGLGDTGQTISQLQIAPTLLSLLALPIPAVMPHPSLF